MNLPNHKTDSPIWRPWTIAAMELTTDQSSGYFNTIGSLLRERFLDLGFFIRPLGNTLYLMSPYCISDRELESIDRVTRSVLDNL